MEIIKAFFLWLKVKLEVYLFVLGTPKTSAEKLTLFVVEVQKLANIGKTDSRENNPCLIWAVNNGRRKLCVNSENDTENLDIVVYRYQNKLYFKDNEIELRLTQYESLLAK